MPKTKKKLPKLHIAYRPGRVRNWGVLNEEGILIQRYLSKKDAQNAITEYEKSGKVKG